MRRLPGFAVLFASLGIGLAASAQGPGDKPPELVAPTEALPPQEEKAKFRLPPGFEAQLVASEPDIAKPMNLAFDDLGRLWVTSSYEYPWPAKDGEPRRDKVTVLSDFGSDGKARTVTTFADGLNIPIGVLPLTPRDALVHSIPNIYHMTDEDGDGKADYQDLFYGAIGFRDTHGMASAFTWGFDGWIYACHGFSNDSNLKGRDGQAIVLNSGNTYRLRPNGMHVEQFTWGQVNPFGLTFDPLGNMYSTDCHTKPIYLLLRGAYYDSFGKPHDGLGYGPDMMTHDHASTGIAGICYYAADAFPKEYQDTIFTGNVVTSRINRDRLEWRGSSPWAIAEDDFLKSDDPWFRPVDIELGPDGNLYVADFYNCIIGHYEVDLKHPRRDRERGRIWRIVYNGKDAQATPPPHEGDFTKETRTDLGRALEHPNLAVRLRAGNLLSRYTSVSDQMAIQAFVTGGGASESIQAHGAWVLERIGALDHGTMGMLFNVQEKDYRLVRVHLMRILAERPQWRMPDQTLATMGARSADPFVRRAAIDALGRHPNVENLVTLLDARGSIDPSDTHLLHVTRMALRDHVRAGAVAEALARSGKWFAIANRPNGLTDADTRALADVMPGVHTPESARWLLGYLEKLPEESPETILKYEQVIARWGDDALTEKLVDFARDKIPGQRAPQEAQLRSIHRGLQERGGRNPDALRAWAAQSATSLLSEESAAERAAGMELVGEFRLVEAKDAIIAVARGKDADPNLRLKAFQSLMNMNADDAVDPLGAVLIEGTDPIGLREQAANLLGQSGRKAARALLLDALPKVPTRLQTAVAAAIATDREGAEVLLKALGEGKASPRLLQEPPVAIRLTAANLPGLAHQMAQLTQGLPPANEAANALIQRRLGGFNSAKPDMARGSEMFKKNCAICHSLADEGAKVGPQLDGIGARGAERLMEDILDPNRNVDQAFRATTLALKDGRVITGLVLRDPGEVIVLADAQGKEINIAKSDVEERSVVPLSPMPANMAEQVDEADFYHLMGYLLNQREKAKSP